MHDLEPFESPKELIKSAEARIAEIEAACKIFSESCDYEVIAHSDPKTRDKIIYVRLKQRFPANIRASASSTIKKLRIALDQAFCDAAIELGRKDAKGIYFPFGRSVDELNREIERKCKNVDRRLIDHCLAYKPHYGGDSDGVLWSMSNLAGKTHQRLIAAGFQDGGGFVRSIIRCTGPLQIIVNKWNELYNQLEVARIPPGSSIEFQKDFAFPLQVIFASECNALSGRPLVASLHQLASVVQGIIFGIEAETARIKAL